MTYPAAALGNQWPSTGEAIDPVKMGARVDDNFNALRTAVLSTNTNGRFRIASSQTFNSATATVLLTKTITVANDGLLVVTGSARLTAASTTAGTVKVQLDGTDVTSSSFTVSSTTPDCPSMLAVVPITAGSRVVRVVGLLTGTLTTVTAAVCEMTIATLMTTYS